MVSQWVERRKLKGGASSGAVAAKGVGQDNTRGK